MNRAGLTSFLGRVQETLEELFPATIRLGDIATEYAAATGGHKKGPKDLADVGLLDEHDAAFRVSKELLPIAPEVGTRLWWKEREQWLRIMRVADLGTADPAWYLGCEAVNK